MKKAYIIASAALLLLMGSCKENSYDGYTGTPSVYFQLDANNWSNTKDSLVYSFATAESKLYTVNVMIDLQGMPVDHDRAIDVAVDTKNTTAQEGLHYEAVPTTVTLAAGEMQATLPVTILGSDPALENKRVELDLELKANDDFQLGLTGRTHVRIIFSNMLTKPPYWDENYMDYTFGTYSRVKHECIIKVLGRDFPATKEEYASEYEYWTQAGYYMRNWFTDNYPVYDENGYAIEPW